MYKIRVLLYMHFIFTFKIQKQSNTRNHITQVNGNEWYNRGFQGMNFVLVPRGRSPMESSSTAAMERLYPPISEEKTEGKKEKWLEGYRRALSSVQHTTLSPDLFLRILISSAKG